MYVFFFVRRAEKKWQLHVAEVWLYFHLKGLCLVEKEPTN